MTFLRITTSEPICFSLYGQGIRDQAAHRWICRIDLEPVANRSAIGPATGQRPRQTPIIPGCVETRRPRGTLESISSWRYRSNLAPFRQLTVRDSVGSASMSVRSPSRSEEHTSELQSLRHL